MYGRGPPPPPPPSSSVAPPIPSSRPLRSIPIPPTPSSSAPTSASSSSFHALVSPSTTSHLISPQNTTSSQWMSSPLHKYHDHSSTTILPSTHDKPISRCIQYKRPIIIGCVTLAIILAIVIGAVMGTQSSSSSSSSTPIIDTANANNGNDNGAQGNTQTTTTAPPTSTPTSPPMTIPGLQFQLSVSSTGVNDISPSKLSTSIIPSGGTGISYIIDPIGVRGYVLQRIRTGTSTVGLSVVNSALGASYTKSLWIYMYDYTNFPNFMSAASLLKNETLGHSLMSDAQGYLYASHNMGISPSSRYYLDDSVTKTPLPINTWTHVAVTYDGNTGIMTLYRNGIQTSQKIPPTGDVSWKSWHGGYNTQIGTWDQYGMNGCVSDMMQFTIALSGNDIQSIYKSQIRTIVTTIKPTTSAPEVTPKPVQATSAPNTGATSKPGTKAPTTADWVGAHGIAYMGGAVMLNPVTVWLVFYGTWDTNNPALTIIPQFVKDLPGSSYWNIVTTYYSVHNSTVNGVLNSERKYVSSSLTYGGMTVVAPYDPFIKTTLIDSDVYYILRNAITQGKLNPSKTTDQNAVYILITSKDIKQGTQCDTTCGWHTSAGAMRYGWVGDSSTQCPKQCQPKSSIVLTPNGDRPADSMISMVAHELIETVVGPNVDSWQNVGTNELADICAWNYLTTYTSPNGGTANLKINGHDYLVQSIWVNKNGGYCGLST